MGHSEDLYGNFGGTPAQTAMNGSGAGPMGVRASPEDFGAQVGKGVENVGSTAGDIANKFANMQMETAQNTAEVGFIKDSGDIKAKYMQYTGSQAEMMRPQFEADMQEAQTRWGQNLPLIASHGYNTSTTRSLRFATSDYAGYAAGQSKQANVDSFSQQVDIGKMRANDPFVAVNDARFGEEALAPIAYGHQMQMDHEGPAFKTDPKTGEVGFDESTELGRNAKSQFEANLDHSMGIAWENRFNTLSGTIGPIATYQKLQQDKDEMPKDAAARLEATLQPQVLNAHASNGVAAVMADAAQAHKQAFLNPPVSNDAIKNALWGQESGYGANSKTSVDGAMGQMQILPSTFAEYAKPGEDPRNAADNKAVGDRIIDDLSKKFNGDPARIAVGYFSGPGNVSPAGSASPWVSDKQDGNGKTVSSYVSDVMARMNGGGQQGAARPYATNDQGAPLSLADWASTHRTELLAQGDAYAEKMMPGDLQLRNAVRSRVTQQINSAREDQTATYAQNNSQITRAFNGDFSQGKQPATWAELEAVPGMRQAIDFASVHSPDFIRAMDTRLTARSTKDGMDKDTKTYGDSWSGADGVFMGVRSQNGQPPKYTDPSQLYPLMANGTLTTAGFEKASKDMQSNEPTKREYTELYKAVGDTIAKKNPLTGQATPEGQMVENAAHYAMDKYIEKEKMAGTSDSELLDPKNKKWVGNVGLSYKPTPQQVAEEMRKTFNVGANADQKTVQDISALPASQHQAAIISAIKSGKLSPETGKSMLLKGGYIRAEAGDTTAVTPTVPLGD